MGEEECRLCTARAGVWVSEVVTASDQAGACCSAVMAGEVWISVRRPLCGLFSRSDNCHKVRVARCFGIVCA